MKCTVWQRYLKCKNDRAESSGSQTAQQSLCTPANTRGLSGFIRTKRSSDSLFQHFRSYSCQWWLNILFRLHVIKTSLSAPAQKHHQTPAMTWHTCTQSKMGWNKILFYNKWGMSSLCWNDSEAMCVCSWLPVTFWVCRSHSEAPASHPLTQHTSALLQILHVF